MTKSDIRHEGGTRLHLLVDSPDPEGPGPEGAVAGPDIVVGPVSEVAWGADEEVILDLGDLLPDVAGEVVLFAAADVPVNILASEPLTEAGIAEAHVTARGLDVTGHHFYSFESGITLYSPTDILIINDSEVV